MQENIYQVIHEDHLDEILNDNPQNLIIKVEREENFSFLPDKMNMAVHNDNRINSYPFILYKKR